MSSRPPLVNALGRYFLAGVFAVLPLVITVGVVIWVAGFVGRLIGPDTMLGSLLEKVGFQFSDNTTLAYLFGWIGVLGGIFLLGIIVELGAKKFLRRRVDNLIERLPMVNGIYGTAKQLVNMLDKKGDSDLKGMKVVYCIFGKENGAAFLALMPSPERFRIDQRDHHVVIVPSAPVPVGGSMLFVPCESVHPADLSVDAFMSVYVSMGVTGSQFLPVSQGVVEP